MFLYDQQTRLNYKAWNVMVNKIFPLFKKYHFQADFTKKNVKNFIDILFSLFTYIKASIIKCGSFDFSLKVKIRLFQGLYKFDGFYLQILSLH